MKNIPIIYVAHGFGGSLENAATAERLTAELNLRINGAVFICPRLPMVRHWPDSGATRRRGLDLDVAAVRRFDGLIALTELVTGVLIEWEACVRAKILVPVRDEFLPSQLFCVQRWVDSLPVSA